MRRPIQECQRKLALLWLAGSGVIFMLVLGQTFTGVFGSDTESVWNWLLPNIVPTVSIIIGTLAASAFHSQSTSTVDGFIFRVAVALSAFYLIVTLGTILWSSGLTVMRTSDVLNKSKYWMAPVQGLLGIALGVFFVSRKAS